MSACALCSLTAPSLLAFDTQRAEGNVGTIDGMAQVPCDTHMRERLDPVSPESLRPSCKRVFRPLQRGKAREAMVVLEGHSCVARAGTGDVSSPAVHCASCLHTVHRNGAITSSHHMVGAAMLPPDVRAVMPLMPEPMITQAGTATNDGEPNAAKRCMATVRQDHPHLTCLITADRLRAHAPHIETLHAHGRHDILGVNDGDHASRCTQVQAAEHAGRVTAYERHDRAAGVVPRVRWINDVPLKASRADVRVHGIDSGAMGQDTVQHCSWVTDVRVRPRHVYQRMRGGRARGKMAHAPCNTLKNHGDTCEPTDGHGEQHLSGVCAMLMLLACGVDHTPQLCWAFFRAVWATLGSTRLVWERLRALCYDSPLESMRELLEALVYGSQKHRPIVITDASALPPVALTSLWRNPATPHRHRHGLPRSRPGPVFTPPLRPL
jgi:hypothetical protein